MCERVYLNEKSPPQVSYRCTVLLRSYLTLLCVFLPADLFSDEWGVHTPALADGGGADLPATGVAGDALQCMWRPRGYHEALHVHHLQDNQCIQFPWWATRMGGCSLTSFQSSLLLLIDPLLNLLLFCPPFLLLFSLLSIFPLPYEINVLCILSKYQILGVRELTIWEVDIFGVDILGRTPSHCIFPLPSSCLLILPPPSLLPPSSLSLSSPPSLLQLMGQSLIYVI